MSRHDHHVPCPGGCNNLSDECTCPRPNPLGSMRVEAPIGSDDPPLVVTRYTGHGINHGTYPADIRLSQPSRVPTPGPQDTAPDEHGHRVPRIGREL